MRWMAKSCGIVLLASLSGCYYPVYYPSPYAYASPHYSNSGYAPQGPAVPEKDCREYRHPIMIEGQQQEAHGTACRQADGTWKTVD